MAQQRFMRLIAVAVLFAAAPLAGLAMASTAYAATDVAQVVQEQQEVSATTAVVDPAPAPWVFATVTIDEGVQGTVAEVLLTAVDQEQRVAYTALSDVAQPDVTGITAVNQAQGTNDAVATSLSFSASYLLLATVLAGAFAIAIMVWQRSAVALFVAWLAVTTLGRVRGIMMTMTRGSGIRLRLLLPSTAAALLAVAVMFTSSATAQAGNAGLAGQQGTMSLWYPMVLGALVLAILAGARIHVVTRG